MGEENQFCDAGGDEQNFIELASHSHSSIYEISLCFRAQDKRVEGEGSWQGHDDGRIVPVFNNLICNYSADDVQAEFLSKRYIVPGKSCFYMSDLRQIRDLIPVLSDPGFNLIVMDPPWENRSVYQKATLKKKVPSQRKDVWNSLQGRMMPNRFRPDRSKPIEGSALPIAGPEDVKEEFGLVLMVVLRQNLVDV